MYQPSGVMYQQENKLCQFSLKVWQREFCVFHPQVFTALEGYLFVNILHPIYHACFNLFCLYHIEVGIYNSCFILDESVCKMLSWKTSPSFFILRLKLENSHTSTSDTVIVITLESSFLYRPKKPFSLYWYLSGLSFPIDLVIQEPQKI